jgi:hypothetical protein
MNHRTFAVRALLAVAAVISVGMMAATPVARAATPIVLSAKASGSNTVTIIFSEPVSTNMGSYSNFTGMLAGRSLTGMGGGGTNTITLIFSGSTFPSGQTGGISVSNTTQSISDGSPFSAGGVSVVDGRAPSLVAMSIASNDNQTSLGTSGNTLNVSFSMSAGISSARISIAGHSFAPSGSGAGPYTTMYALTAQDASYSSIPVSVTYTDGFGNTGTMNFTFNNSVTNSTNGTSGTNAPYISSITSDARSAGTLKIGDTVTFTVIPLNPTPNGRITGSYNGVSLAWSTSNNGVSYTGTYTVANGNSDETFPIQITGVTLTDQYGNVSASASGSDVVKMISANPPFIYESTPIPSATGNTNPTYGFVSNKGGMITFGGDCTSPTTNATAGTNTITFVSLQPGTHSNCTLTVTDSAGNMSNILKVSTFTVIGAAGGTTAPVTTSPAQTTTSQTTSPASSALYTFTAFMSVGSSGAQVTNLQKYLSAKGFFSGSPTGYYGALTQAAVKKYQTAHGINPAGYVGPGTRAAMNAGE